MASHEPPFAFALLPPSLTLGKLSIDFRSVTTVELVASTLLRLCERPDWRANDRPLHNELQRAAQLERGRLARRMPRGIAPVPHACAPSQHFLAFRRECRIRLRPRPRPISLGKRNRVQRSARLLCNAPYDSRAFIECALSSADRDWRLPHDALDSERWNTELIEQVSKVRPRRFAFCHSRCRGLQFFS